jgi:hypothetical protein
MNYQDHQNAYISPLLIWDLPHWTKHEEGSIKFSTICLKLIMFLFKSDMKFKIMLMDSSNYSISNLLINYCLEFWFNPEKCNSTWFILNVTEQFQFLSNFIFREFHFYQIYNSIWGKMQNLSDMISFNLLLISYLSYQMNKYWNLTLIGKFTSYPNIE